MNDVSDRLIAGGISSAYFLPSTTFFERKKKLKRTNAIFGTKTTSLNSKTNKILLDIVEEDWPTYRTSYSRSLAGVRLVAGRFTGGDGNDLIKVTSKVRTNPSPSEFPHAAGVCIENWGENQNEQTLDTELDLGTGNDKIIITDKFGSLDTGLYCDGLVDMGDGKNLIKAKNSDIIIGGKINFGSERDILTTKAIKGSTKDNLSVHGVLSMGGGDDLVEATKISVANGGMISMGEGDDVIKIHRKSRFKDYAIYSNGTIDMGDGDDRIEGLLFVHGTGRGDIYPGYGAKVETNFGPGEDTLVVTPGTYVIEEKSVEGIFRISTSREGEIVDISGLEYLESSKSGARFQFTTGTLEIL